MSEEQLDLDTKDKRTTLWIVLVILRDAHCEAEQAEEA